MQRGILCIEKVFFLYFIFLINEERVQKKYYTNIKEQILMLCCINKVDGKWYPLKFFLVNILYCNSFTLEHDLFSS